MVVTTNFYFLVLLLPVILQVKDIFEDNNSSEGALRRLMTDDNHPTHLVRQSLRIN